MPRERYYTCPDCGKRGIYLRFGEEDWWMCRYCRDFACCYNAVHEEDGRLLGDPTDVEQYRRLMAANPGSDLIPS